MTSSKLSPSESTIEMAPDARLELLKDELKRLERRDWWLWVVAICVMLLLTSAVLSMSFPGLIGQADSIFQQSLEQAVRGLVGLVLLFNIYSIYQQMTIKRTRRQLSEELTKAQHLLQTGHHGSADGPGQSPHGGRQPAAGNGAVAPPQRAADGGGVRPEQLQADQRPLRAFGRRYGVVRVCAKADAPAAR